MYSNQRIVLSMQGSGVIVEGESRGRSNVRVQIRRHGIEGSEELNQQVQRRIHFALGRFSTNIRSIGVHLTDTNGPRGGPDKDCRVLVNMRSGDPVVIQELNVDIHAAVALAAERAGRAVARQLSLRRVGNGIGRPLPAASGD